MNKLFILIKRNPLDVLVILLSLLTFCMVTIYFDYLRHWVQIFNSIPDTKTYIEVGAWLTGQTSFEHAAFSLAIRPIGYPAFLITCLKITPVLIILFQSLFWVISQWLIFRIAKEQLKGNTLPFLVSLISISTIGAMLMNFLGLSESLYLFLLISALYFLNCYDKKKLAIFAGIGILFLALGAIVRPSGFYPFILVVIYFLLLWFRRPTRLFMILVFSLPIIMQTGLMFNKFNSPSISFISYLAIDHYLLARYDSITKKISFHEAREIRRQSDESVSFTQNTSPKSTAAFVTKTQNDFSKVIAENPVQIINVFNKNIYYNVTMGSPFVNFGSERPLFEHITRLQNLARSFGGGTLALISLFVSITHLLTKFINKTTTNRDYELLLSLLTIYFILTTGFTLLQGDRITLPVYQLFPILLGIWTQRIIRFSKSFSREIHS